MSERKTKSKAQNEFQISEDGLRLLALGFAMTYGYSFAPQCLGLVNDMIRLGVTHLRQSGSLDASKIRDSQNALGNFISEMVREARKQGSSELHEFVFDKIRKALCPLPPWLREPCPK
jgi:hypothetical protein